MDRMEPAYNRASSMRYSVSYFSSISSYYYTYALQYSKYTRRLPDSRENPRNVSAPRDIKDHVRSGVATSHFFKCIFSPKRSLIKTCTDLQYSQWCRQSSMLTNLQERQNIIVKESKREQKEPPCLLVILSQEPLVLAAYFHDDI